MFSNANKYTQFCNILKYYLKYTNKSSLLHKAYKVI